ncbi:unknown protein [Parachlamydia acanthamoebae UV-7]|uniref:Uncharacterized protein n=1 Tax=Parachlamydia acanthamoebae (strain UV7) TaxID=765952 RepID=F8KV46_PARAV|nr:unknown protein [Parachlamydia acanthamoebae UV-7]
MHIFDDELKKNLDGVIPNEKLKIKFKK